MNNLPLEERIALLTQIAAAADVLSVDECALTTNEADINHIVETSYFDGETTRYVEFSADQVTEITEDNGEITVSTAEHYWRIRFHRLTDLTSSSIAANKKPEDLDIVMGETPHERNVFSFNTLRDRMLFVTGLNAAEGWLELCNTDEVENSKLGGLPFSQKDISKEIDKALGIIHEDRDNDNTVKYIINDENGEESSPAIDCKVTDMGTGLYVGFRGYQDDSTEDWGDIVKIDYFQGILRVLIWADKDQEDPTHKIDLAGAKKEALLIR